MSNLDPGLAFALGAVSVFCLALIVALSVAIWFGSSLFGWLKKHMSGFDEFGASRDDGKVKLGAELVDLARKPSKSKRKSEPVAKPNGRDRERLS